jgi:queuine tRNA-ribosyltransferase
MSAVAQHVSIYQQAMSDKNPNSLKLPHGTLALPTFLPDATYGYVRSVDSADLAACGIGAVVMNAFHLMMKPGSTAIKKLGGLHTMYNWDRPIVTDSGGFQAYSMIRQNKSLGKINKDGIVYHPQGSERKVILTPEKSIRLQVGYGADIVVCLDDCTHAGDDASVTRESVVRTIDWARRSRTEFDRLIEEGGEEQTRPLLFGVIQGGTDRELRKRCAEELVKMEFDGFGFGGYPLDEQGRLLTDVLGYVRELVPAGLPLFGLGIGHPASVVACARLGYDIFDCSLPTRDARQGRLYRVDVDCRHLPRDGSKDWLSFVYIEDEEHAGSPRPIGDSCDCLTCTKYSRGFLHHLQKQEDGLYLRLATMHNLRTMSRIMEGLRGEAVPGANA